MFYNHDTFFSDLWYIDFYVVFDTRTSSVDQPKRINANSAEIIGQKILSDSQ